MNRSTVAETMVLGAITGMRTAGGPTALALRSPGKLQSVATAMAIGEMIADKTPFVGNRIDPLPLAGRACMGALVGGTLAREHRESIWFGALLGASTAVAVAHLAFRLRKKIDVPNVFAGLVEDAIVYGIATYYASPAGRRAGNA